MKPLEAKSTSGTVHFWLHYWRTVNSSIFKYSLASRVGCCQATKMLMRREFSLDLKMAFILNSKLKLQESGRVWQFFSSALLSACCIFDIWLTGSSEFGYQTCLGNHTQSCICKIHSFHYLWTPNNIFELI